MNILTRYLLWLYVFAVSGDTIALPLVGSASRAIGLVVVGTAVLTKVVEGRLRKPDGVFCFAMGFFVWNALSLLWTLSYGATMGTAFLYAQLIGSLWVIREFVRTREQVQTLLTAFFLGLFVPLFDLLKNFRSGAEAHTGSGRFTGSNLNADMLGLLLAIGLPLAWYLFWHGRGAVRALSLIYLPAGPLALLLTGTRGAFLAGLVGFSLIPITLRRLTLRTYALAGTLLLVGAGSLTLVPQSNWDRMATIPREIVGGGMTGRSAIWRAGLQAFHDHEILGAGAGAYGEAAQPYYHTTRGLYAHNLPVNLLVEGGVIGFGIFAALLGACAWTILHLRPPDRTLWCVLMLTWAVGNGSVSLESTKLTWVLFGLISALSGLLPTVESLKQKSAVFVGSSFMRPAAVSRPSRIA
jgi:O-antigen ligase